MIQYGIDEVGRGAFAGPLVAASVYVTEKQKRQLKKEKLVIRDSKTLSERQREAVYEAVIHFQIQFDTEYVAVEAINRFGIGWANTTAIRTLIERSPGESEQKECIVDGYFPAKKIFVPQINIRCVVDADATIFPVILAGIMAKVTRDRMMKQLHENFQIYKWNENKGYGTKYHIDAIKKYGVCPYHREQFVKTALQ